MEQSENKCSVILFDGVCNFCNSSINFVLKRDKKKVLCFAPIQSASGKQLINKHGITVELDPESVILIRLNKIYYKSSAVIEVLRMLGGVYAIAVIFKIIPVFIRDFFYDIIAKNRYKLFGKKNSCMIPNAEIKSRFLG